MRVSILCLLLLITFPLFSQEESFYVFRVDGKITYGDKAVRLKSGDILKGNPEFYFSTSSDKAKLWGEKKGYWYLYPNEKQKNRNERLGFLLLENIQTQKEYTATRGNDDALTYLFFDDTKLIAAKEVRVFFIPKDSESHYFFEFKYKENTVRRKLVLDENKTLLVDDSVLKLKKENIDLNELSYGNIGFFDAASKTNKMLKGVQYAFVDVNIVKNELQLIKKVLQKEGKSHTIIEQELTSFLKDTYGSDMGLENFQLK